MNEAKHLRSMDNRRKLLQIVRRIRRFSCIPRLNLNICTSVIDFETLVVAVAPYTDTKSVSAWHIDMGQNMWRPDSVLEKTPNPPLGRDSCVYATR